MSNLTRSLRVLVYTWLTLIGINRAAAVEAPTRIMPLGDSITFGQAEPGVEGGYRDRLYSLLTTTGFNVDFVGTFTDTTNPELPDKNHQGAPGFRVDEINASIGGWLDSVEDPDVILIQIGTNDFLQTSRNETPTGVLAELNTLITTIATKRPFAKIVVSTLILSTFDPAVEAKQVLYNQGMPGIVAQQVALGRHVTLVDLHPVLNAGDLYDLVHPTTAGYEKMADAWLPAVNNVIGPKGTTNPPLIAKTETPNDLTKLWVTFSKPVADSATTLSNFNISGGLTVTAATLDSAKRKITLITTPQTPGETYTLTVSGVRDRTTQQRLIAPVSRALFYPNLLSNGSFETTAGGPEGYYNGWTIRSGSQEIKDKIANPPYSTPEGNKMVAFNTGDQTPNGVLGQTFSTTPGQTYLLTYNLGIVSWRSSWTQRLDVALEGDNPLFQTTSVISGNGGSSTSPAVFWFPWSYQFTADSSTTTLRFTDVSYTVTHTNRDMLLDNVRITAPAASTLAVTSTPNAGAGITINQTDLGGNGNGNTGLIRSYSSGTAVTLTAPSSVGGRSFQKWQINGADFGTNATISTTITRNTILNAVYDPSGTIPPAAVPDSYTTNEDTALTVTAPGVLLNDSDVNALPLTVQLGTAPTKGTLVLNSNGSFTYTPTSNPNGADSFTYRVSNGTQNSAYATVSIGISPVAVDDGSPGSPFLTIAEDSGQSSSMSVLDNDTDVNGDNLTIIQALAPNGLVSTSFSNTKLRFTPAANFNGPTTISYSISDGNGGTSVGTVYVNVTSVNDAPVAVNDGSSGSPFLTVAEDSGQSFSMTVLSNDSDVDGDDLTITTMSSPNGSVVTSFSDTRLRFTPATNFNGPTTISYTVSDGNGGNTSATVYVSVTPVNDPPVAVNDGSVGSPFLTVAEDSGLSSPLSVLGNDTDVDGNSLTITAASSPNGSVGIINSDTQLRFTPAANFNGATTISYSISDGNGGSANATVHVSVTAVNDPPVAVNDGSAGSPFLTVAEDSGLSSSLSVLGNDTDVDGQALTITAASSPNGSVSIVNVNTQLRFTPTANFNGAATISYTVSDGAGGSASATVHVNVTAVNDAPVAVSQSVSTSEDVPLVITLAGSDIDGDTLTSFSIITQPQHGTLTGSGSTRTYTPNSNYNGPDNFTFKVSDASLQSVSAATVSITVNPVNDAPVAGAQSVSTSEDTALAITLTGSDVDGDPLSAFTVTTQPLHGTLTGSGTNRTYTPAQNYNGPDSFNFTVSDGSLPSVPATISITVTAVNDPPVAVTDGSAGAPFLTVAEDSGISPPLLVLGNDTDVDGQPLTITAASSPNGSVSVVNGNTQLQFTPATNFNGATTISYTVSDGNGGSASATVHVSVTPVNDPPVAVNDGSVGSPFLTVAEDSGISSPLSVLVNDTDVDGHSLTITAASSANGSVSIINTSTQLRFTPATNFNGATTISYTISDGNGGSASSTVQVSVTPVNDAPVATAQSVSTSEDTPLAIILAGSDIDGDTLTTFDVIDEPLNGTLSGSGANLTYTPDPNSNGPDSFTFTVSDASLQSVAAATVSISVTPVNDAPSAAAQSVSTDEDSPLAITLAGSDIDGDTLSAFTVITPPQNGVLSGSGTNRTYTPNPDFHGSDSFTFTVSDDVVTSPPATVSVVVNPIDDFIQWLEENSVTGGPTDDPDGNSISNALEFVLGANTGEPSLADILPSAELMSADMDEIPGNEEYMLFTYRRSHRSQLEPSTIVQVEWAPSLAGPWTTADGSHGEVTTTVPGDPVDLIKVHIPRSNEGDGLLFTRLKVVVPEPPPPDE